MLNKFFWWRDRPSPVDPLIAEVLREMERVGPSSDEYPKLLKKLEKLYKIKDYNRPKSVSIDTIVATGGTVLMVILVVAAEKNSVITSKATQFIRPLRMMK